MLTEKVENLHSRLSQGTNLTVKLTDFGISRANTETNTDNLGTKYWDDPDYDGGNSQELLKNDIFSFSCLFFYVINDGCIPQQCNIGHHLRETFKLGDKVCCWPNREFGTPAASLLTALLQQEFKSNGNIVHQ